MPSFELTFRSHLATSPGEVWAVVSTMDGVNTELGPWVRMTHPASMSSIANVEVEPGRVVVRSWLLAFGVVPFDRHALRLERVVPGEGFDEESSSWMQRRWRHERRVLPDPDHPEGCVVTDRLVVEPRVPFATALVRRIVQALFTHHHRRLVARFADF